MITTLAFDADDTLWHNESIFARTQERFRTILGAHVPEAEIDARLIDVEKRNLRFFGYGIKGFTLSMVETAVEITHGRITGDEIAEIVTMGKDMLDHPVELLPGVAETIERMRRDFDLMIITKGDLFDQESKIARSGLADRFQHVEIVSEKDSERYRRILGRHGVETAHFMMVGNSLKSDVLPVVEIGARAVHVPYEITWAIEHVETPPDKADAFWRIERLPDLANVVDGLARPRIR